MRASRWSGLLYIVASGGFLVVFAWLANHFDYPDILARDAAVVLPRLYALGTEGRAVWSMYALLPLLLIPAVAGAAEYLRGPDDRTRVAVRLVICLQVVAALCMTLGLARWSTSHWSLAVAWSDGNDVTRDAVRVTFDALNIFLGVAIGEFVGELALYGSFIVVAIALHQRAASRGTVDGVSIVASRRVSRVGLLSAATGATGWIGMFRNVTPVVQLAADAANVLLPLFLIVFGITLLRDRQPEAV